MKKRLRKRIISMILVIAICSTDYLGNISAQTNQVINDGMKSESSSLDDKKELSKEQSVIEKTTNTTTFKTKDGKKELVIHGYDVRFEDANGELVDYDSSLVDMKEETSSLGTELDGYSYTNKQGDMKHYIPEFITTETPIILEKGDYQIAFAPVNQNDEITVDSEELEELQDSVSEDLKEPQEADSEEEQTSDDEVDLQKVVVLEEEIENIYEEKVEVANTVSYSTKDNVLEYQYKSLDNGVKEEIVLYEKPITNIFSYEFTLKDLTAELVEDTNEIVFYNANHEIIGGISAPNMNDASQEAYSEDIKYELNKKEGTENAYVLQMNVSQQYLEDEDRQYPVTVDPTVSWTGSANIQDAYVIKSSAYSDYNFYSNDVVSMAAGNNSKGLYRTYMQFVGLQSQIKNQYVESATLSLFETGSSTGKVKVQAHRVNASWKPGTITWNKKPSSNATAFSTASTSGTMGKEVLLDLTAFLRNNANGTASDYGICLKVNNESTDGFAQFYSSRYGTSTRRPKLKVVYYDGPTTAANVFVTSSHIKAGETLQVNWEDINSKGLSYVQYKVMEYDPVNKVIGNEYVGYSTSTKLGTTSKGGKSIAASANWKEGCYRIYVRGVDKGGIKGTGKGATFYIDGTLPKITTAKIDTVTSADSYSSNMTPTLSWNVSDANLKNVQYSVNGKKTFTTMSTSAQGSYKIKSGVFKDTGKYTIYIRAVDKAGNVKDSSPIYYYYKDKAAPVFKTITISPDVECSNDKTPTISWSVTDTNFKNIQVKVNNEPYTVLSTSSAGSKSLDEKYFPVSGMYTIRIKAIDNAGNFAEKIFEYNLDTGAPNISDIIIKENEKTETITVSAVDANYDGADYKGVYFYVGDSKGTDEIKESQLEQIENYTVEDGKIMFDISTKDLKQDIYNIYLSVKDKNENWSNLQKKTWYYFRDFIYDGMFNLSGSYDSEAERILLSWENEGVAEAIIYEARNEENFVKIGTTNSGEYAVKLDNLDDFLSYRLAVRKDDGTCKLSSILTFQVDDGTDEELVCLFQDEEDEEQKNVYLISSLDSDGDGLANGYEMWELGTDPYDVDSDGDGFNDYYEVAFLGTSPIEYTENKDSDGDGLDDLTEYENGTNPYLPDSDFDSIPDASDTEPLKTKATKESFQAEGISAHKGLYDLVRVEESDGVETTIQYNPYSSLAHQIDDSAGGRYVYFYDVQGNKLAEISHVDKKYYLNTYCYDDSKLNYIFHNGFGYELQYEEEQLASINAGGYNILKNQYDEDGNITSIQYGNNQAINRIYKDDKLAEVYSGNKLSYKYSCYEDGSIRSIHDYVNDVSYEYVYDSNDKLQSIESSNGFRVGYEYQQAESEGSNTEKYTTTYLTEGESLEESSDERVQTITKISTSDVDTKVSTVLISGSKVVSTVSEADGITTISKTITNENNKDILTQKTIISDQGTKVSYEDGAVYIYEYDSSSNITKVLKDGEEILSYEYDSLGQLLRENNKELDTTLIYTYDLGGNITSTSRYAYTTSDITEAAVSVDSYVYGNESWKDLLTSFNGDTIQYDEIGNPIKYRDGLSFSWTDGRKLASYQSDNYDISYKYNADGLRSQKIVNGVRTDYFYDGEQLVKQVTGNQEIWLLYNDDKATTGFELNGEAYYYKKNIQGDVIGIYDSNGVEKVTYCYDAWGNIGNITGDVELAKSNPISYRSYYTDYETGFYYLQSRYYDPVVKRYLNADDTSYLGMTGNTVGYNLFTYCSNNPVNDFDPWGTLTISSIIGSIIGFGAGAILIPKLADYYGVTGAKRKAFIALGVGVTTVLGGLLGSYAGKALASLYASGGTYANTLNTAVAKTLNKIVGGKLTSARGNGWIIKFGKYTLRVMSSGGGRKNYLRLSLEGKGALTLAGKFSSDRGLTHIQITVGNLLKMGKLLLKLKK